MDIATISAGLALAKGGFEALRTAVGLVKDVQQALPAGEKKETLAKAIEEADRQIRLGEAEIARALGYQLCRCAFPPTPMLTVGDRVPRSGNRDLMVALAKAGVQTGLPGAIPVHECPLCEQNDAGPWPWKRSVPQAVAEDEAP